MTEFTHEDREGMHDILEAADVRYWADAVYVDGKLRIREREDEEHPELGTWHTVQPLAVLAWLMDGGATKVVSQIGDAYQQAAVALTATRSWDDLDYDVETGDLILQVYLLGEVRYG